MGLMMVRWLVVYIVLGQCLGAWAGAGATKCMLPLELWRLLALEAVWEDWAGACGGVVARVGRGKSVPWLLALLYEPNDRCQTSPYEATLVSIEAQQF